MIKLTTLSKLRIAKLLAAVLIFLRRLFGKGETAQFCRKGIRWQLTLSEGIDLSIFLFGRFERGVYQAYERVLSPGAVALDIGANIGAHTLPMASLVGSEGRVIAFEPTVFALDKLQRNLDLNPRLRDRVEAHHALLNDGGSEVPSALPSSWNLASKCDDTKHPQHGGSFKPLGKAQAMSLDQFTGTRELSRIDLIKLDVDGNEWSVIQGSERTLRRYRPKILMEFAPDYDPDAFANTLRTLSEIGYEPFRLNQKRRYPTELNRLRNIIPKNGSINVLLVNRHSATAA